VGRVGNFRQKNYSAEDGIDGTDGYFRRNSGCSSEQKTLGIPFRTLPRNRKLLGIPFRWTKIEASSLNSLPNTSAEEKQLEIPFRGTKLEAYGTLGITFRTLQRKRKQLGIPFRGTKIEANSRNSVPNHSAEEKTTRNSVP
jgi:hypothetical protein